MTSQLASAEIPSVTVAVRKGHRFLLTAAALAAALVTYVLVRSATFSGAFDTALTIFLTVCFASMGVLKLWVAVTGFLPAFLRARLTARWNGRA
jgi:hypothetical protein